MTRMLQTETDTDPSFLLRQHRALATRLVEHERTLHSLLSLSEGSTTVSGEGVRVHELAEESHRHELEQRTRVNLEEVEDALSRIENGTYGLCSCCGQTIARSRLLALPETTLCAPCKAFREMANVSGGSERTTSWRRANLRLLEPPPS